MVFASECGVLPARASSRFRRISPPEVGPTRDHKQHVGAGKGSQGWLGVIDRALREEKAKMQAERRETARSADPLPPAPTRSYLPGETAPTLLQEAFRKGSAMSWPTPRTLARISNRRVSARRLCSTSDKVGMGSTSRHLGTRAYHGLSDERGGLLRHALHVLV